LIEPSEEHSENPLRTATYSPGILANQIHSQENYAGLIPAGILPLFLARSKLHITALPRWLTYAARTPQTTPGPGAAGDKVLDRTALLG
jgi:hypothetical protein